MSNQLTDNEIIEEKRRRQLAILKASNELLRQAKENALKHNDDPIKRADLESEFNKALDENRLQAKNYLHATEDEVENASYKAVGESYIDKYNKRLAEKGLSDTELHRKDAATVSVGKGKEKSGIARRHRRGAKKDESEIVRLENEEELMMQTMVKSESDIEAQREKNRQFEEEMAKKQHDIFEKVKEEVKERTISGKISVDKVTDVERVKVENKPVNIEKPTVKIENATVTKKAVAEEKNVKATKKKSVVKYDFDFSNIPSYVQYDVIPLPSKGMCYPKNNPLRCGHVPVAYLTAADENIMYAPNVYRDGKLLDIILDRKVLDKRININDLTSGDRDAIILWLRATSYGEDFPISATNPSTGKQYNVTIKLSQFDYNDFELESDDDGLFSYTTQNGDEIKFKFLTNEDQEELKNIITSQITDSNKIDILRNINKVAVALKQVKFTDEEKTMLDEDINEIKDIVGTDIAEIDKNIYPNTITEQMIIHTIKVNGNEDREFIKNYIENMRTKDAMEYRNYFVNNKPGVDFNFNVNIPESDGGGSFATFLKLDDTVFLNF